MIERPAWNSVVVTLLLAALCAAVGIVALPLLFGSSPSLLATIVWLVAAIVTSVLLIALALQLSAPLANAILHRLSADSITSSQALLLARLLMIGLALVATQSILRRPVALLIGGSGRSATPIEAGIAAAALAAVLALLVWMYETARPMVQAATLRAIDAAIPTTGTALVAEPTRTSMSVVSGPVPSATDAVTIVAPLFPTVRANGSGVANADDATEIATQQGQATVLSGDEVDATQVSRPASDQPTVVSTRPDDHTLRVQRS
jgi:hypothetical protein